MKLKHITTFGVLAAVSLQMTAQDPFQETDTVVTPENYGVNLAFRTSEADQVMGGISVLDMEKLNSKRYSNYSLDGLDAFVGGYNGELWNQGNVLVLVDGIPRDANNVLPGEIAQITFMKGAQAVVLYGSQAAKGAILITTKRGTGTGLQVSVHGNYGLYVPKSYPKYLGATEYMTLYNKARSYDGLDPAFSDEDIWHYASGENTWRYPNTNFFSSDYLKKSYNRYEGNIDFMGGGKFAKFYATIGLYNLRDLINFGEGKKNNTTRLNVRGNIDLTFNEWITGWINANATFYNSRGDLSDYWMQSAIMRPTTPGSSPLVPLIPISYIDPTDENSMNFVNNTPYLIDGKYLLGGTQLYPTNPFAGMYAGGHTTFTSRHMQFDSGIKINLDKAVKGLSFSTKVAVDYLTEYNTTIRNEYATYQANWTNFNGSDQIGSLTKYNEDKRTGTQLTENGHDRQTIYWSGQLDYDRCFASVHNFSAMAVAQGWSIVESGKYHNTTNANIGIRAAYNYDNRYYAEFNSAIVHSSKLAPGHRTGFSPVGTLGWRIGQESWLKDNPNVNELKLDVTYGLINQDLDISDYYMYEEIFTQDVDRGGTWWGWNESANALKTANSQRGANYNLTFVKRKEFNIGLTGAFWNNSLVANLNFFDIKTNGLLTRPENKLPNYLNTYYPKSDFLYYTNFNNQSRRGFDFTVKGTHKFGQVELSLGVSGMYYWSNNDRVNETVEYDWLKDEGRSIETLTGYHCLGFFQTPEEIANSAVINNNTKPGDLKYEDMNGDGIIDSRDKVAIGKWRAPWNLGVNLTVKYKGFTLFAAGSGSFGGTAIKNSSYYWVYGDGKYSEVVRNHWTEETAETATYPRLTTESGELNFVDSDFWTVSTSAFYLNTVQLTYDFPGKWFRDKFVKGISLYAQGQNLATISKERKFLEMNVGSAPQCRVYNFGFKIEF